MQNLRPTCGALAQLLISSLSIEELPNFTAIPTCNLDYSVKSVSRFSFQHPQVKNFAEKIQRWTGYMKINDCIFIYNSFAVALSSPVKITSAAQNTSLMHNR